MTKDSAPSQVTTMPGPAKFFISGMGKSGSTWLQLLLNNHPQIVCLGEGQLFAHFPAHLSKMIEQYDQAQDFLRTRNFADPNIPGYPLLDRQDVVAILRFCVERVFSKFPATPDTRYVGDKSPQNTQNLPLILEAFPDARILHIVRDPRDVLVSSWHHWKRAKPGALADLYDNNLQRFAGDNFAHWLALNTAAMRFGKRHPRQFVLTTYEGLSADPARELRRMLQFLGVSAGPNVVDHCVASSSFEKLSGRQRGEADNDRFFRRGSVGAWRDELPEDIVALLPAAAQDLMREIYADAQTDN